MTNRAAAVPRRSSGVAQRARGLRAQMIDGISLESTTVTFGVGGRRTHAGELLASGERLFSSYAASGCVGAILTNDRCSVEVVLGASSVGVRLISLPLPARGADVAQYVGRLRQLCASFGVTEVVVADEFADLVEHVLPVRRHADLGERPLAAPSGTGFELVQFTSGSTGPPRAVALDDEQLGANVEVILSAVVGHPGEAVVSWLPLSHDMGLVGTLFTGMAGGADLVILDPRDFLRRPHVWVEALSRSKGVFTAAPDSGYRLAAQRGAFEGADLSALRCAIVGGEVVRADTLQRFSSTFADHGLDRRAMCPAYGMAELGVAAAITPRSEPWRELPVSPSALAGGMLVPPAQGERPLTLVASGPPLPGYAIDVLADDTGAAKAGPVGTLRVSGPSFGHDGATGARLVDEHGAFRTGDRGFVRDGWVYVCGRSDDYLVSHGRNIFAPVVEAAVGEVDGVRAGRAAAVGLPSGDWVLVVERSSRGAGSAVNPDQVRRDVRQASVEAVGARPDDVVLVDPGVLPLTSSGKLQRHRLQAGLLRGELDGPAPGVPR